MKKLISIGAILVAIAIIVLAVVHFAADTSFPGVYQLLLSIFMFLLAYIHIQQKRERDVTFWLLLVAGAFSLVVAFDMVQPFF